jgi:ferritin-like protein
MPIAWHAPYELLRPETRDMSRAIHSLMEELEAMDWYSQRIDVTDDEALKRILAHHADEEKEHAVMLIEWIRRRDPSWDEYLRTYLITTGDIIGIEEEHTEPGTAEALSTPSARPAQTQSGPVSAEAARNFTVGSLRPGRS